MKAKQIQSDQSGTLAVLSSFQTYWLALGCMFLSGLTGLVYEICWIRKASLVFGTSIFALSSVTAVFFGGLACGSYMFGRYTPQFKNSLIVYAILELIIGILALFSPLTFSLLDSLYESVYPLVVDKRVILFTIRFLLIVTAIFPITFCMGGSLPLFCDCFIKQKEKISSMSGILYGINTLGAVTGCMLTGFILLPQIGINQSMYLGAIINILIGLIIYKQYGTSGLEKHPGKQNDIQKFSKSFTSTKEKMIASLFFLTGFIALGNEILWARFLTLVIQNTVYVYTITLSVVLIGIVLGAIIISFFSDTIKKDAYFLGCIHLIFAINIVVVLSLPMDFWSKIIDQQNISLQLWIVSLILLIPSVISGMSYPMAIKLVVRDPDYAGSGIGYMGFINTAGAILGSLLAGLLFIPTLGVYQSFLIIIALSFITGSFAILVVERKNRRITSLVSVFIAASIALILFLQGTVKIPQSFVEKDKKLIAFKEGLNSNIAVVKNSVGATILEIDRLWQGEDRASHQIMAAHIPMILHSRAKDALVVGIGVGQTAAHFLNYDLKSLDCIDIEPELFVVIQSHFESAWMEDERVTLLVEDGRNYITHTNNKYDVISIEIGQTFRPGCASFYTHDFYKKVKKRLNTNGLVSQFVPLVFLKEHEFLSVIKTFITVFPNAVLWYNNYEFLLLGSKELDLKITKENLALLQSNKQVNQNLEFYYWGGTQNSLNKINPFMAGFLCDGIDLQRMTNNTLLYTDNKPLLEYSVARNQQYFGYNVLQNIEALKPYLSKFSSITAFPLDNDTRDSLDLIRHYNLYNIPANDLYKQYLRTNNVSYLKSAFEYNPNNLEILLSMAMHFAQSGDLLQAEKLFLRLLKGNPDNVVAHTNFGLVLDRLGKVESAIEHYSRAIKLAPDHTSEAHNNLGVLLAKRGEYKKAFNHFSRAVQVNPEHRRAINNLNLVTRQMKK